MTLTATWYAGARRKVPLISPCGHAKAGSPAKFSSLPGPCLHPVSEDGRFLHVLARRQPSPERIFVELVNCAATCQFSGGLAIRPEDVQRVFPVGFECLLLAMPDHWAAEFFPLPNTGSLEEILNVVEELAARMWRTAKSRSLSENVQRRVRLGNDRIKIVVSVKELRFRAEHRLVHDEP